MPYMWTNRRDVVEGDHDDLVAPANVSPFALCGYSAAWRVAPRGLRKGQSGLFQAEREPAHQQVGFYRGARED